MANRLSEDAGSRVLLLEAGGKGSSMFIHMPASAVIAARDTKITWGYEPEPYLDDHNIDDVHGRVLGGSSSVNGWAANGLSDWSFAHCLLYFRKMETFDRGANDYRDGNGPQHIETCPATKPLNRIFVAARQEAGYLFTEDQNGRQNEGFHIAQKFTCNGKRLSTAAGYLKPALSRPNLTLQTRVHRVVFDGK